MSATRLFTVTVRVSDLRPTLLSPLYVATIVRDPVVAGVQLHLAVPVEIETVEQPVIAVPFSVNKNVPVGV